MGHDERLDRAAGAAKLTWSAVPENALSRLPVGKSLVPESLAIDSFQKIPIIKRHDDHREVRGVWVALNAGKSTRNQRALVVQSVTADTGPDWKGIAYWSLMNPEETIKQSGYVYSTLANGVGIHILPTKNMGVELHNVAALQFWVSAGTSVEEVHQHGCAHMLEHMVFKPIELRSGGILAGSDLALFLESIGGDINAYTDHDETVYYATVPANRVQEGILAITEALFQPDFDETQFRSEQEVVVEEIYQYDDDPASRALQRLLSSLYRNHSYGRPVLAEVEEVRGITRKNLLQFRNRNYCGKNLNVVVVGPVQPKPIESAIQRSLANVSKAKRAATTERVLSLSEPVVLIDREDVHECSWRIAWDGPEFGTEESVALDVAAVCLGQGDSSRLIQVTRRREQLVSDAYASYHAGLRSGSFLVSGQCESEKSEGAINSLLDQVDGLVYRPLRRDEIQRAKSVLRSSLVYNKETVQGMAHTIGYYARHGNPELNEREYFSRLSRLSASDVQRACEEFLDRKNCVVVGVMPESAVSQRKVDKISKALKAKLKGQRTSRTKRLCKVDKDRNGQLSTTISPGLRVIASIDRTVPIVGAWLVWPGGQGIEPSKYAGSTALMANLLIRGTEFRSGEIWSEELDSMAATIDGFCGHSTLGLQMECLAENWPDVLSRGLEAAIRPRFDESDFEEERRVFLQDIIAQDDDLASVAYRLMLKKLYRTHPYGRDRKGTPETLHRFAAPMLKERWSRSYAIEDATFAICGDIDFEQTMDLVEQSIVKYQPARMQTKSNVGHKVSKPQWPRSNVVSRLELQREQAHLVIGYPGLPIADIRGPTLDVLLQILGGQSGRLFLELRENLGLVYDVGVNSIQGRNTGHVAVYAAASQSKFAKACQAIDRVMSSLLDRPLGNSELERAKVAILGQYSAGLQRRVKIASSLAIGHLFMSPKYSYLDYPRQIEEVTVRKVQALAKRLFGENSVRAQGIVQASKNKKVSRKV